jgi:lysophospholipase L1-like esterase
MFYCNKVSISIAQIAMLALLAPPVRAGNEKNFTYLALGESISFGLNPNLLPTGPGQALPSPKQFTGYPEIVAQIDHLQQSNKEVNASCPGETSASFLDATAPDNGCNSPHVQPPPLPTLPPFKTSIGLHTNYSGSQMAFAQSQLASNKHINLVTLSIGGNDILLLLAQCAGDSACVNGKLPGVLQSYGENLWTILTNLRHEYNGTLVLVTYYAPSPALIPVAQALNSVIVGVGSSFDVKIADGFQAFQLISALYGGDPCAAGLVIKLNDGTCDVHPTLAGQGLLAAAVEVAIGGKK